MYRFSVVRVDLVFLTSFLAAFTSSSSSSKRLAKRFSEDYTGMSAWRLHGERTLPLGKQNHSFTATYHL